jgi:hypothetical protein
VGHRGDEALFEKIKFSLKIYFLQRKKPVLSLKLFRRLLLRAKSHHFVTLTQNRPLFLQGTKHFFTLLTRQVCLRTTPEIFFEPDDNNDLTRYAAIHKAHTHTHKKNEKLHHFNHFFIRHHRHNRLLLAHLAATMTFSEASGNREIATKKTNFPRFGSEQRQKKHQFCYSAALMVRLK